MLMGCSERGCWNLLAIGAVRPRVVAIVGPRGEWSCWVGACCVAPCGSGRAGGRAGALRKNRPASLTVQPHRSTSPFNLTVQPLISSIPSVIPLITALAILHQLKVGILFSNHDLKLTPLSLFLSFSPELSRAHPAYSIPLRSRVRILSSPIRSVYFYSNSDLFYSDSFYRLFLSSLSIASSRLVYSASFLRHFLLHSSYLISNLLSYPNCYTRLALIPLVSSFPVSFVFLFLFFPFLSLRFSSYIGTLWIRSGGCGAKLLTNY